MKILILGGAGSVALATARDLLEIDQDEVTELVIADLRFDDAHTRATQLGSAKVTAVEVDITDKRSLVALAKSSDIMINEAHAGKLQLLALKAALEAGTHYLDLGTFPEIMSEQLKLNAEFERAGLTAILGLGSGPGINNVIARALADKLDSVESIIISFATASLAKSSSPLSLPYDVGGLWALFTLKPIVFEDGKYVEKPSFYSLYKDGLLERSYFPEPIGKASLGYFPHIEPHTIPVSLAEKGVKTVCVRGAFNQSVIEKFGMLIDIGLTDPEPTSVRGVSTIPQEVLAACIAKLPAQTTEPIDYGCTRVVVSGKKNGCEMEYKAEMFSGPYRGLNGVQHRTGHAPAIGARMIHRGVISRRGAFPPEIGVPTEPFFKELGRRDLKVSYSRRFYV